VLVALQLDDPDILFVGYECAINAVPSILINACAFSGTQTNLSYPRRGTVTDLEGRLVDSANPAVVGGYYTIWLTGLGNTPCGSVGVNCDPLDRSLTVNLSSFNLPSPVPAGYETMPTPLVVTPTFAGASPQFPGLEQINFQLAGSFAGGLSGTETLTGAPFVPLWPCANYTWEMTLSARQVGPATSTVQIPVVIRSGDVACQ